jgi:hypothetical protein
VEYVSLIETGKKSITSHYALRQLCDILDIPLWKVGLSEYDPFDPDASVTKGPSMYDETLNSAEVTILDTRQRMSDLKEALVKAKNV